MSDKRTEERNDTFDSAMREKLSGYEPAVPHALWSRISAELNETEVSDATDIVHHTTPAATPKWKIAIAAAIVITLGAGSLLFTLNPKNDITSTSPVAVKATPTTNTSATNTSVAVSTPVSETKTVAVAIPAISKSAAPVKQAKTAATAANTNTQENANQENPAIAAQNNEDNQLASMPPASQNNPVEVGTIPVYSLNKLTSPVSLNDEITVIKSVSTKKKHHRHNDEETTKVIVLGKKYDSKPDIRYQVPVRF